MITFVSQVIKLYVWEIPFQRMIFGVRQKELDKVQKEAYLKSLMFFTLTTTPFLVSYYISVVKHVSVPHIDSYSQHLGKWGVIINEHASRVVLLLKLFPILYTSIWLLMECSVSKRPWAHQPCRHVL